MAEDKKSLSSLIYIVILAAIGIAFYFLMHSNDAAPIAKKPERKNPYAGKTEPTVVQEELKVPAPQKITAATGRTVQYGETMVETPLVPHNPGETVIVPRAIYTVKGAYEFSLKEAKKWKSDAKLSFVKSFGAVTVDGKSSEWQVVFVSAYAPKKSYEVIIGGDIITSKRELESSAVGADLPYAWFDSGEALQRLAELPQFQNATITGINFLYNTDAKAFRYGIATSEGITSLRL